MKKILFLSLIFCLFICCNENLDNNKKLISTNKNLVKINNLIEQFLNDTIISNINYNTENIVSIDSIFEIKNIDSIINIMHQNDSIRKLYNSLFKLAKDKNYNLINDDVNYINDTLLLYNYLEVMKNQEKSINRLYENSHEKFIGWIVRYKYETENLRTNGKVTISDTFILNPDFTKVINYTSNNWDQATILREKIIDLKIYVLRTQLNYKRFQMGLPAD